MKIKTLILASIAALFFSATTANAQIVDIMQNNNGRTLDNNPSNGLGNSINNASPLVGSFGNNNDTRGVWVFEMTGIVNPADITTADFSVTNGVAGTPTFDVSAHVIRTASTSGLVASDHQTSAQLLSPTFLTGGTTGSQSLDAAGETTLGDWLRANWVEGDFVFIGLRAATNAGDLAANSNNLYNFNDGDGLLSVTVAAVPEPSSMAFMSLSGLLLVLRRRRS